MLLTRPIISAQARLYMDLPASCSSAAFFGGTNPLWAYWPRVVVFLYGSMVWGIFPIKQEMSWEGHLFGLIAGILIAFNYRKEGPKKHEYQWEEEEEEGPHYWETGPPGEISEQKPQNDIRITYTFKEKDKE